MESQSEVAARLYSSRADTYDDSWHPVFATELVSYLNIQAGWHILDLACGTGLVTFAAARKVGPSGFVTGVDISEEMLSVAGKQCTTFKNQADISDNIEFVNYDITRLKESVTFKQRKYDAIICASALWLLDDPKETIVSWATLLKPGGRILFDMFHPKHAPRAIVLERVASRLGLRSPWYRTWCQGEESIKELVEAAGLEVDEIRLHAIQSDSLQPLKVGEGERVFSEVIDSEAARPIRQAGMEELARITFLEEWRSLADELGNIDRIDAVFMVKCTWRR